MNFLFESFIFIQKLLHVKHNFSFLGKFSKLLSNPIDVILDSNENRWESHARRQWPRCDADNFALQNDGSTRIAGASSSRFTDNAADDAEHLIRNIICSRCALKHCRAKEIRKRCHHQLLHLIGSIANRWLEIIKWINCAFLAYNLTCPVNPQPVKSTWDVAGTNPVPNGIVWTVGPKRIWLKVRMTAMSARIMKTSEFSKYL